MLGTRRGKVLLAAHTDIIFGWHGEEHKIFLDNAGVYRSLEKTPVLELMTGQGVQFYGCIKI